MVLEKTLESPLYGKEIKQVQPKGNLPGTFIGRTDAEAGTPTLWPPDAKSWLLGKYPDAGKDWRREAKGTTEDEMVGWHHRLNAHEFEQAPGVGDGQGRLRLTGSQRVGHGWATELKICHAAEAEGELCSLRTGFGRGLHILWEYGETLEKVREHTHTHTKCRLSISFIETALTCLRGKKRLITFWGWWLSR